MCFAVPMRIIDIDGFSARCEARGVERTVNLMLMQHESLVPGDLVMVHAGYASQRMSEAGARSAWELYDEMLAADGPETVREAASTDSLPRT